MMCDAIEVMAAKMGTAELTAGTAALIETAAAATRAGVYLIVRKYKSRQKAKRH